MKDRGIAHIGIGTGKGDDKATDAVKMAVESPLLETKINGASNVIINISGDITLADASDASEYVRGLAGDDVNVIFGAMYDESKTDTCTITVIATGIDDKANTIPVAKQPTVSAVAAGQPVYKTAASVQPVEVQPQTVSAVGGISTVQAVVTPSPSVDAIGVVSPNKTVQAMTLNRPSEIRSTVEPKSLKIPDFLQRK
jgi:cell division protein FtsZ